MDYRVIVGEYVNVAGDTAFEVVEGTEVCIGDCFDYATAQFNALQSDTSYQLAWYEVKHNGKWYNCDSNGNPETVAPVQKIQFDDDTIEMMNDDPEEWGLQKDANGIYAIPTHSY